MSDKTEYSRLLLKRTGISGEVPTIPPITATTLNEFNATDLFVGEMYVNTADDLLWVRTDSGILPISLSGSTGTTIPDLLTVLSQDNITGAFPIVVSSGSTIQYLGLNSGTTTTILGLDASGNTITTTAGGGTPSLDAVLAVGNTTGIFDIIISTGTTIQSPNGENEIYLQKAGQMGLKSTYTLTGTNYEDELKMRAPSGTDAGFEIISTDTTNGYLTKREHRPTSIKDFSFDNFGAFVETRLESSGFTIDLSNTSAGYLTIDGLLTGTAVDLLGIDSNNRVVPVETSGFTTGTLGITIDGAGTAITTGVKGYIVLPYNATITSWNVVADQSGSVVVDVWKDSSYTIPTGATQSIAGTEKPTLSSQQINSDLSLSTWTTSLVVGDVIAFNVDSATTVERITLQIKVIKL